MAAEVANQKIDKHFITWKYKKNFVVMFAVPKDIAHKIIIKSNHILQKIFNNFDKGEFKTKISRQIAGK